jgi:sterol desaturase/sphingolipid hydroxylase (fatty acid hydroxylase superfamily)
MKSSWAGRALIAGGIATLLWLERRKPLRRAVDRGPKRIARNLAVGAITAAVVSALERPLVQRLSVLTEKRNWGIVPRLPVPSTWRGIAAVLLMDYTLYWWHVLLHRSPLLWRLHEPHHADLDLDASTGVRFHFAEFLASIPWRCAQVVAIGVGPRRLAFWQKLTLCEVLFHHANARLSMPLERRLSRVIVTPRMHGIHHSVIRAERDSNFSSGLSVWDRLHATSYIDLSRDDVKIGLSEHQHARDVTVGKMLALPFHSARRTR